ncbi:MAG: coenzyme F420-0:L-glutamate ligase [Sulfolobales archaeon]
MTDKIISKSFGLIVDINNVVPSKKALSIARKTRLDPRFIELVLRNSDEILAVVPIKKNY